jgi:phosphopantetheinyl transferase (holo-ACP synthase)
VENIQNLLRFMEINSELKKYLDYRISDIINDIKKFKKILSNLAKGIITELTNPTEIEIFKKTLSTINAGNILESILLYDLKTLLKDQLYNINLNDKTSTRKMFIDIIRKSSTLNLLFSLKESQIKALIEICVAPIIFESFVMV